MGKFDKEIKEGQKIADGWLKRSKDDEAFFIGMKKNGVAWEKDEVKRIEALVKAKKADEALDAISNSEKWLKDYQDQCKDRYEKHAAFVRGAPRDGAAGICDKLKIGKKDEAYQPVMEGLTKTLMEHTKQFKQTENAWEKDLKVRIKLLYSKLDTLRKLAAGAEKEMGAYGKQFAKDGAAFKEQAEKMVGALKVSQGEQDISAMTGDKSKFVGGNAKFQKDKYALYCERVGLIPKLIAMNEKNYNRVLKSVPQEVRDKMMFQRGLKSLEIVKKNADTELKKALLIFKTAKATFEKNFAELV